MDRKSLLIGLICWFALGADGREPGTLHVGDTVPDISLGTDLRTGEGTLTFSQLRGKLVILDFWSTWCASCIQAFPKMQRLQRQFGDRIQILLVNPFESRDEVTRRMALPKFRDMAIDGLTVVVEAGALQALFPHRSVPHHVWVDQTGMVRVIGSSMNTNSEKIHALLGGEEVEMLPNDNNSRSLTRFEPLSSVSDVQEMAYADGTYRFTPHLPDVSPTSSLAFEQVVDSVAMHVRDTYVNHEVAELYKQVFREELDAQAGHIIYQGPFSYGTSLAWLDHLILEGVDTLALTSGYLDRFAITDRQFVANRYGYEQVLPMGYGVRERSAYMLDRLNGYFGQRLGIQGQLVERWVPCYIIRYSSKRVGATETFPASSNRGLKQALRYPVFRSWGADPAAQARILIDEAPGAEVTGLPTTDMFKTFSMDELLSYLELAGLELVQGYRALKFIVFKPS